MTPQTLSSSSIAGTTVVNAQGENLGNIKELMIDTDSGRVAYAVLSFGGFLGLGDKYFAMPWEAFRINSEEEKFVLNVDKERLQNAPGFDKDNWPTRATHKDYLDSVYNHYGYTPYWRKSTTKAY